MPLDNTASIQDIISTLEGLQGLNQKADLRSVLADKGIDALDTDSVTELITKLSNANLVLDGKTKLSGVVTSSVSPINFRQSNGTIIARPSVTVSGLPYIPTIILVENTASLGHIDTAVDTDPPVMSNDFVIIQNVGAYIRLTDPAYINEMGFQLPVANASALYRWVAFE